MHARIAVTVTVAVLSSLVAAPPALGGGWAAVELSSTPDSVGPGQTWKVDVTVLQHGRTPLEGVRPAITITDGEQRLTTPATVTGEPGVYHAEVTFPTAGRWRYVVDDGFTQRHTYPPVQIGGAAGAASGDGMPWGPLGLAALAGLAAAGLLSARQRRRVPGTSG
jgi:hypothetical protein